MPEIVIVVADKWDCDLAMLSSNGGMGAAFAKELRPLSRAAHKSRMSDLNQFGVTAIDEWLDYLLGHAGTHLTRRLLWA